MDEKKQMREILFRGQTRRLGELVRMNGEKVPSKWVYGGICQGEGAFSIIYGWKDEEREAPIDKFIVYSDTVGQYTGLTDKNGKKIFEGDILSVTVREYTKECGIRKFTGNTVKTVWSVEYAERRTQGNGFFVFGKDRRFSLGLTKSVIYNASPEIIGNIHDNSELLRGEE